MWFLWLSSLGESLQQFRVNEAVCMRIKLSIKKEYVVDMVGPHFKNQAYHSWSKELRVCLMPVGHPASQWLHRSWQVCVYLRMRSALCLMCNTAISMKVYAHSDVTKTSWVRMTKYNNSRALLQAETEQSLLAQLFSFSCPEEKTVLKALSHGVKRAMRYELNPPSVFNCLPGSWGEALS